MNGLKTRVLIVDDERDLAWMLKLNLERTTGYDVLIETNPLAAVETARTFLPDVVLLDLIMPQCSGGGLATQIATALQPRTVRVVFLTAALPATRTEDAVSRTFAGYPFLSKPVTTPQLLNCLSAAAASIAAA